MKPQQIIPIPNSRLSPEDHRELLTQTKSFLDIGRMLLERESQKNEIDKDRVEAPRLPVKKG